MRPITGLDQEDEMTAIAPITVLLMGLLGLLVVGYGLARIVVAERRLQRSAVLVPARPATPPAPFSHVAA